MKIVVVICASGSDRTALDVCVGECQRQIDPIVSEGEYSFEIVTPADAQSLLSSWHSDPSSAPDLILWLSSPFLIKEGTVLSFIENSEFLGHRALLVGTVTGRSGAIVHGGWSRKGRLVEPDPVIPVPCHTFDPCFLMFPGSILRKLSSPSDIFRNSFYEYAAGSRLVQAGIPRVVAPGIAAVTDIDPVPSVWKDPSRPMLERSFAFLKHSFRDLVCSIHSLFV